MEPTQDSVMDALGVEDEVVKETTKVTVAWDNKSADLAAINQAFGLNKAKGKNSSNIRKTIVAIAKKVNNNEARIQAKDASGKWVTITSQAPAPTPDTKPAA